MNTINLAIQVLPQKVDNTYDVVDKAIAIIAKSGYKYKVCPFETVVECKWEEALKLVSDVKQEVLEYAPATLIYIKLQVDKNKDVTIDAKTGKYDIEY